MFFFNTHKIWNLILATDQLAAQNFDRFSIYQISIRFFFKKIDFNNNSEPITRYKRFLIFHSNNLLLLFILIQSVNHFPTILIKIFDY